MSDTELIRFAAKAAGINALMYPHGVWRNCTNSHPAMNIFAAPIWNPLTDDGDALRLAVRLNFDILQDPVSSSSNFVEVLANLDDTLPQLWAYEVRAPDPLAATRRAIVRAAAEIGKAMT